MNDLNNILTRQAEARGLWLAAIKEIQALQIDTSLFMGKFFCLSRRVLTQAADLEGILEKGVKSNPLEILQAEQKAFYAEVLPTREGQQSGYDFSFANPDFACEKLGRDFGQLLSVVYLSFRSCHNLAFTGQYASMLKAVEIYKALYQLFLDSNRDYATWKKIYVDIQIRDLEDATYTRSYMNNHPDFTFYRDIVMNGDFSDLRYLYEFGIYLADRDIQMAEFSASYPEQELRSISKYIVQAHLDGFERGGKDYKIKKYASLMFPLGMERLAKMIAEDLEKIGLTAMFKCPMSMGVNRQYNYDVRFANALYLDQEVADRSYKASVIFYDYYAELIRSNGGPVYVEVFGEEPFEPKPKETALKLSDEQRSIQMQLQGRISQYYNAKFPRSESSFCIIAFPSPEIGKDFQAIFRDTIEINRLDSNHYARIQQHIIEVLDQAEYVHVLGVAGNETDIRVAMHKLNDPTQETNFENCVADVNIPVGEVFTSPMLTGTNGTLHVEDIYLNNLRFLNLKIHFEDGFVKDYSCSNFEDEAQNKLFVEENLLHPHKTLPIGEFAIGTNTMAYKMARKYDIMHLLPILIIEKMGPHFAIGDTCYSHEEDFPHHNIESKKLIIAVDNEKSAKRNEDPMQAYTQKHTDITLPYEMLAEISAVKQDGTRLPIIKEGRFVVPGTEELNLPLLEI
ncbi:MAG: aminopeptidase [Candidatus Cloacimonetes bacterium]|nr:aminopeptidase [Candidatus Cloacimonadota bacterium]